MYSMPTINMVKTGKNIVRLRELNGFTVKELQAVFGFSTPQAIYKWQSGMALPSLDHLVILATVFQVTLEEILIVDTVV